MAEPLALLYISLTVLSPVHVGTGEQLGRKSFVSEGDLIHVVNEQRLLEAAVASPQSRNAFLRFCENPQTWLKDYLTNYRVPLGRISAYTVSPMGESPKEILPFIKSPGMPPHPYLPGSSLKGALRSALLRSALLDDAHLREIAATRVQQDLSAHRKSRSPGLSVEQEFFGPDQHHDLMRLLQIADTRPISPSKLQVAEVRALSSRRDSLEPKRFTLSPEVLSPGTKLRGQIGIKAYLLSKQARSLGLDWGAAQKRRLLDFVGECNRAANDLIAQEIDFFDRHNERDLVDFYKGLEERVRTLRQGCLLRLGWGTGFDDKAVTDVFDERLFDDVREAYGLAVGRPGRRGVGLEKALSPKSRKIAFRRDGPPQPLGWLQLDLI